MLRQKKFMFVTLVVLIMLISMVQCKWDDPNVDIEGKVDTDKTTKPKDKNLDDEDEENKAKKALREIQLKLHGFYIDQRPYSDAERYIPFFIYMPLCALYILAMFVFGLKNLYKLVKFLFKQGQPTEAEIKAVDDHSINLITLAELEIYNQNRKANMGEDQMLNYGNLYNVYAILNQRSEFNPDDTFSQKTAVWVHIYKVMNDDQSYVAKRSGSIFNQADDEGENFSKMENATKAEFTKAQSYRNKLQLMCWLSVITSGLALSQIFESLIKGERIFVLCSVENAVLRFCFTYIILMIGIRDIQQIAINLFVRISGVMMKAEQSRWVFVEPSLRLVISILAMSTILITIFTTPKDGYEGVIDQTMNFTALVILLEIDNILGELLQKRIDQYEIDFSYNKETIEKEFNIAADFILARQSKFYLQRKFELFIQVVLGIFLFCAFSVFPVVMLLFYVIIPPTPQPTA